MKRIVLTVLSVFCLTFLGVAADNDTVVLKTSLRGLNEVPPVASQGTGSFEATLSPDHTALNFTLTFNNLNAPATVSHIHFAFRKEAGGVVVFLCGPGTSPAKQPCPSGTSGTVTGTLTAADIVGPTAQGINSGDFEKLLKLIDQGGTYVNVHSTQSPAGEIRGQIRVNDDEDHDR